MTEYHFPLVPGGLPGVLSPGRNYLLEINPHYSIGGTEDKSNVIDARWIDTETGLFIDISTIRKNWTAIEADVEGALMCKDRHHYLVSFETPRPPSLPPQATQYTHTHTHTSLKYCGDNFSFLDPPPRKKTSIRSAPASSKASPSASPLNTPGSSRRNTAVKL